MARSASYHGLRRGSTKSHTYSVFDGKQITKDRVEGGKDPRTPAQLSQRCLVSTAGAAYGAMKSIVDHSFEGVTAGLHCMREFQSANLKQLQICREEGNATFGFNRYKEHGTHAGSYIVSKGSLATPLVDASVDSVNVAGKKVTLSLVETDNGTVDEVADAMGCRYFDDMCTVALLYPKSNGTYGFGAFRFTYKSGATVLESFSLDVVGDIVGATASFAANTLTVEVRVDHDMDEGASTANTYMTAITSRKVNGKWLRSNAQFNVTDATPTFETAIATYPVGQARFLNGGSMNSTSASQSDSGSSGSGGGTNTGGGGGTTTGGDEPGEDRP